MHRFFLFLWVVFSVNVLAKNVLEPIQVIEQMPNFYKGMVIQDKTVWGVIRDKHAVIEVSLLDGSVLKEVDIPFVEQAATKSLDFSGEITSAKNGFFVKFSDENTIYKLHRDGSVDYTFTAKINNNSISHLIWDGHSLWVYESSFRLHRINAKSGVIEKTIYFSGPTQDSYINDFAFYNNAIWISANSVIWKISPDTGFVLETYKLPEGSWNSQYSIDFYDKKLWVSDRGTEKIEVYAIPNTSIDHVNINLQKNWFKPELLENNDPLCKEALSDIKERFFSDQGIARSLAFSSLLGGEKIGDINYSQEDKKPIFIEGTSVYTETMTNPGCGGACETYSYMASSLPFPKEDRWSYDKSAIFQPSPPAQTEGSSLGLIKVGSQYLLPVINDNDIDIDILELKKDRWVTSCKIRIKPESLERFNDEAILDMDLRFRGDSGYSCGSMATHSRWSQNIAYSLEEAFYQPWSLHEYNCSAATYGCYANDMLNLEKWSLLGINEYEQYQSYINHLGVAIDKLAKFYVKHNSWPIKASKAMAKTAIEKSVTSGVSFYYDYQPYHQNEFELRRAILHGDSIETIKQLPWDDAFSSNENNLLSTAIKRPDAMQYLLEKGVNPDQYNGFGKTALMYAAQFNQLETARILLEGGANPNLTTFIPDDNCFYTLHTGNMTALHYAVRYASAELITLLLQQGALTNIKTSNQQYDDTKDEYPLDWLYRYTSADAVEKNPYLVGVNLTNLVKLLEVPSAEVLLAQSQKWALEAEQLYKQGSINKAYQKLQASLKLSSENTRALANMSLVALKVGNVGESLQASTQLIQAANIENTTKANAWFNLGLACDSLKYRYFGYRGESYCREDQLTPYLNAYRFAPTDARKAKIVELFDKKSCEMPYQNTTIRLMTGRATILYFLASIDVTIKPEQVSWSVNKTTTTATQGEYLSLGTQEIIIINSNNYQLSSPLILGEYQCNDSSSPAVKSILLVKP